MRRGRLDRVRGSGRRGMVPEISSGKFPGFVLPISLLIVAVLLAAPSRALGQTVDRSLGLRELKPGYYIYLHGDDTPGVSSTFNSGIILTDEGVVVIDALGSESIAR